MIVTFILSVSLIYLTPNRKAHLYRIRSDKSIIFCIATDHVTFTAIMYSTLLKIAILIELAISGRFAYQK